MSSLKRVLPDLGGTDPLAKRLRSLAETDNGTRPDTDYPHAEPQSPFSPQQDSFNSLPTSAPGTPNTPNTPNTAYTQQSHIPGICPHCGKDFSYRPSQLKKHLKVHVTERPHACDQDDCTKAFKTEKDLKEHVNYNHLNQRNFECPKPDCDASFNTAYRLRRHDEQVHQSGIHCPHPTCNEKFRSQETLTRHLRVHDGLLPFPCKQPDCDKAFPNQVHLSRHMASKHSRGDYWCCKCDLFFRKASELKDHHRKTHFPCQFCPDTFQSEAELHNHVESKHVQSVEDRKTIPCPDCPKLFTRTSNLNAHHRTVHLKIRFVCGRDDVIVEGWDNRNGCDASFTTKVKMIEHIRYIHLGHERPDRRKKSTKKSRNILEQLSGGTTGAASMETAFRCQEPGCTRVFKRVTDFEKHTEDHQADTLEAVLRNNADSQSQQVGAMDTVSSPFLFDKDIGTPSTTSTDPFNGFDALDMSITVPTADITSSFLPTTNQEASLFFNDAFFLGPTSIPDGFEQWSGAAHFQDTLGIATPGQQWNELVPVDPTSIDPALANSALVNPVPVKPDFLDPALMGEDEGLGLPSHPAGDIQ